MPQALEPIRWGIAGSGDAARRFAQCLPHVPATSVASVFSRNPLTARSLAESCNAALAPSLHALLDDPSIDAIYIATLPDSHAAIAHDALHAGKAVLCEKPVTVNSRELEAVLSLARASSLLFMEAMKPPFFPVHRKLMQHLQHDPLGRISHVRSGLTSLTPPNHPSWLPQAAGGGLLGIGVYHAFLSVQWLGPADTVHCDGSVSPRGVDSFATVHSRHGDGHAEWFCGLEENRLEPAVIHGELGTITMPGAWWRPDTIHIHYHDGRSVSLQEPFLGSGFQYETEHFCALLRAGAQESPIITHARYSATMAILDQARSALGVTFPADR